MDDAGVTLVPYKSTLAYCGQIGVGSTLFILVQIHGYRGL